jgi:hypothetical protein
MSEQRPNDDLDDLPRTDISERSHEAWPFEGEPREADWRNPEGERRSVTPAEEGENTRGLQGGSWDYRQGHTVADPVDETRADSDVDLPQRDGDAR